MLLNRSCARFVEVSCSCKTVGEIMEGLSAQGLLQLYVSRMWWATERHWMHMAVSSPWETTVENQHL